MRGGARHTSQASQEAAARSGAFSLTAALTVGDAYPYPYPYP